MSDIKTQKEENPYCYAWFVAIIFIGLILIYLLVFIGRIMPEEKADLGVLGDYIGGVLNPIISFIALLFLIKTFTAQKEAFELQKEELELTREELKKSAEALEKQNETIELQRFETTFFNLCEEIKNQSIHFKNNIWPTLSKDIKENFNFESKIKDIEEIDLFIKPEISYVDNTRKCSEILELIYDKEPFKKSPNPFEFIMGKDKENYLSKASLLIEILFFTLDTINKRTNKNNGLTDYRSILKIFVAPELICFLFTIYIHQKHSGKITTIAVSPYIEKYDLLSWLKHHDWEKYILLVDKYALEDRHASEPKVFIEKIKAVGRKLIDTLEKEADRAQLIHNDRSSTTRSIEENPENFLHENLTTWKNRTAAALQAYEAIKDYVKEYKKENPGLYDMDVDDDYHNWLDRVKRDQGSWQEAKKKITDENKKR